MQGKDGNEAPLAYRTELGQMLHGTIEAALSSIYLRRRFDLIFTSPPFPLHRKKKYGNRTGDEYLDWLGALAPRLARLLKEDGSLVVEIGNAWEPGSPTMSTLPLESLLRIKSSANLHVCQQFICHNPARLPGPAQWVNIERIRVKDSYTHVWWYSKGERPKANNRRVLVPYGKHMETLLKRGQYNSGRRPSGHKISDEGFLRDNGGAIPASVLEFSNTQWHRDYVQRCREIDVPPHPARMQPGLVEFFIKLLTNEGDHVLDPFAGSNTTGAVAERMRRRWTAVEPNLEYILGSLGQMPPEANPVLHCD